MSQLRGNYNTSGSGVWRCGSRSLLTCSSLISPPDSFEFERLVPLKKPPQLEHWRMRRAANYTTMQRVAHDQGIILGHNTINAYCSTATDAQRSCRAYVFKLLYLSGRLSCHCALLHESSNNFSLYIYNQRSCNYDLFSRWKCVALLTLL